MGSGNITAVSILKKLYPELNIKVTKNFKFENKTSVKLKGLTAGMSYHLAGCCSPIKGDNIVGIVTAGIGVAVHTVDCETLSSFSDSPERWLDVSWERDSDNDPLSISRINIIMAGINKTISEFCVFIYFFK